MTTHLHHLHAVDQPDTELRCRHLARIERPVSRSRCATRAGPSPKTQALIKELHAMTVAEADDPHCSVGDVVEATETNDGLALSTRVIGSIASIDNDPAHPRQLPDISPLPSP